MATTYMLRGVRAELRARVRALAERKGLSKEDAALLALEAGLGVYERAARLGSRQTSEQARAAAQTRWARKEGS